MNFVHSLLVWFRHKAQKRRESKASLRNWKKFNKCRLGEVEIMRDLVVCDMKWSWRLTNAYSLIICVMEYGSYLKAIGDLWRVLVIVIEWSGLPFQANTVRKLMKKIRDWSKSLFLWATQRCTCIFCPEQAERVSYIYLNNVDRWNLRNSDYICMNYSSL